MELISEIGDSVLHIIKAVVGILAIVIGFLRKPFMSFRKSKSKSRVSKLNEKFYGYVRQGNCKDQCELILNEKGGHLKGTMTIFYGDCGPFSGQSQKFIVRGSYKYNFLLTLEYSNEDESIHQAGVAILEFAPDGNSMKGGFKGYGPITKDIDECWGEISLDLQR